MWAGFDEWLSDVYAGNAGPMPSPPAESVLPYQQAPSAKTWSTTKVLLCLAGVVVIYHAFKD